MDLKFGELPINHSFVAGPELYVKISATQAVSVTMNKKTRFRKFHTVSILSSLKFNSFTEGSASTSWDRKRVVKYVAGLKDKAVTAKRLGMS